MTLPPGEPAVLLVDDEQQTLRSYELLLRSGGVDHVVLCDDSRQVLPTLERQETALVLLDLMMPHITGEELLPRLLEAHPDVSVIVVTGTGSVESAVDCMRRGAYDYIVKPVEEGRILGGVRRALELWNLRRENSRLSRQMLTGRLEHPEAFESVVTRSAAMQAVFGYVEAVADSSMPLLITGETGVGKELLAHAAHRLSGRTGAFVPVNVAGLDDHLFADTLFGHERGAFTGAEERREGLIERARGGTIFLDEVGDLSPVSQLKLLRVLQEREYLRVGSDVPRLTDARVMAATNRGVEDLLNSRDFRKDLFYRLRTHHAHIPPLRDRPEDIALLTRAFVREACDHLGRPAPRVPEALPRLLSAYPWPGNVREMRSMIFDACSRNGEDPLSEAFFREQLGMGTGAPGIPRPREAAGDGGDLFAPCRTLPTLREAARSLIDEAMRRSGGNQTAAARLLGISQSALSRRLRSPEA